ncbi:MAG: hypothetical protein M0P39_03815 [Rhodocyclaceae bacterium]|nr:hypothetical protein [Rhodocyclaceae bacterium]
MQRWIWILFPSFAVACLAEFVFFSVIDPQQLYLFGEPVNYSPIATYSICFFGFWLVGMASTVFSVFLQRSPEEINRRQHRSIGHAHRKTVLH